MFSLGAIKIGIIVGVIVILLVLIVVFVSRFSQKSRQMKTARAYTPESGLELGKLTFLNGYVTHLYVQFVFVLVNREVLYYLLAQILKEKAIILA